MSTLFLGSFRWVALATVFVLGFTARPLGAAELGARGIPENDLVWTSLGTNENDSLPVGNGDLAANVWTETNGDVVILLAKNDAWSDTGSIVKLGRVRLHLEPSPFTGPAAVTQALRLEDGSMQVQSGDNSLRLWVDANHPALQVETHLGQPASLQASVELWRKHRVASPASASHSKVASMSDDLILPTPTGRVTWCHYNETSEYPEILRREHLEPLLAKYPDPYLHRCFGATLTGTGLAQEDAQTLRSAAPQKDFTVTVIALTETDVPNWERWQADVDALAQSVAATDLAAAWSAHQEWWQSFWDRSWVQVSGSAEARAVSEGYAMQRYMLACSSRGAYPTKFNGGLFTVGHDLAAGMKNSNTNHDADFRAWGECYWNQNNRLLYWPLLATGDYDLLQPWFNMYVQDLPLAKDRAELYYHHAGASLPETMYFFGLPKLGDFGVNNPSNEIQSRWQRYHIQGTLEVVAQMLDYYDQTGDAEFARTKLVPFADAMVTFYDRHYPRAADGRLRFAPAQSLETYQLDAVNPTPDIAGLRSDIPRLLALPTDLTTESQRAAWAKTLGDLPPIPLGRTTAQGKIPPLGESDPTGRPTILPAEHYGPTRNMENPELYVTFPYQLYGVGQPGLELAREAYAARKFPQKTCWGQDGTQASVLGLTDEAKQAAVDEFKNYGQQRFPWFWRPGHDWIPDLDNGGNGMITLQNMLMRCVGQRIILLPAWPKDWTADFKLHAPGNTTVEGRVEHGQISNLHVTPEARAKDVEVWRETGAI